MNQWRKFCRKCFYRKGHRVHSPFVFDLITNVIEQRLPFYGYKEIDLIRLHLRLSNQTISYRNKPVSITSFLRKQDVSKKEGELLFRLANHYKPQTILTLGSSMGLVPLYLTGYSTQACCIALEYDDEIAAIAQKAIKKKGRQSIRIYSVKNEQTLPNALEALEQIDCLYLGKTLSADEWAATYRQCRPLMHKGTMLIVNGIHTSSTKRTCWKQLCNDTDATVSVDLCRMGLIFFDPKLHKRMYKSRII